MLGESCREVVRAVPNLILSLPKPTMDGAKKLYVILYLLMRYNYSNGVLNLYLNIIKVKWRRERGLLYYRVIPTFFSYLSEYDYPIYLQEGDLNFIYIILFYLFEIYFII